MHSIDLTKAHACGLIAYFQVAFSKCLVNYTKSRNAFIFFRKWRGASNLSLYSTKANGPHEHRPYPSRLVHPASGAAEPLLHNRLKSELSEDLVFPGPEALRATNVQSLCQLFNGQNSQNALDFTHR